MTIPGDNPLAYQGVKAPNPPNLVLAQRAPNAQDISHDLGSFWLNELTDTMYVLVDISAGTATWDAFGGGSAGVDTLTGDSGGAISPVGGNITLGGGTNVTSAGAGSTLTFNLDAAISLATSVTSPLYTAPLATDMDIQAAAGQDIDIQMGDAAGANNVSFFSSTPGLVTSLDSLGTFTSLGDMITSRSDAGVSVTHQITNSDNTSLTSNAQLEIASGGASGGDAGVVYQVSGVATNWFAGLDNSDTDAWVLSASATAGTNNAIRVDHATQNVQIIQALDVQVGNITAVNGNLVATAGNLSLPGAGAHAEIEGGAATDFIGTATLTAGTVTIAHTGITAADRIMVTRSDINGSTALGVFEVVKTPATNFVINARNPADATIQTNDVSVVEYVITRQL